MKHTGGTPRKVLSGFRRRKEQEPVTNPKKCPKCGLWFPRTSLCFDRDNSNESGLQSWCIECKDQWEHEPAGIFRRMWSFLRNQEPVAAAAWGSSDSEAQATFERKYNAQNGECKYCGAGLREWQVKGHNLDRIDNGDATLHTPQNTNLACFPCNITRGRKRYGMWLRESEARVAEYGWGRVPWGEFDDRFARVVVRRCKHLAVPSPQPSLFGGMP